MMLGEIITPSELNSEPLTLMDILRRRALAQPYRIGYTYLLDGEGDEANWTYEQLDEKARAIAALIQQSGACDQRVLLMYPSGLEFIAAFLGCLYAGAIAVPAYPPDQARLNRSLPRFQAIVKDAKPVLTLTNNALLPLFQQMMEHDPELRLIEWVSTDELQAGLANRWQQPHINSDSAAFLQYTSGSTATPKGVIVSHANLIHNQRMIQQACNHTDESTFVGWLPLYHDMGLIGNLLQPLYIGSRCVLMSPQAFLQKPLRWLQAITRYRAATSGGPDFAYGLCVRKIVEYQKAGLDLSCWTTAFNGSEPVRYATLEAFAAAFESCGFRREAFFPCYGLAEATLIVTGRSRWRLPVTATVASSDLERNRIAASFVDGEASRTLVGCGGAILDEKIIIVNTDSLTECLPDEVGEIWISSPSVAQGYWNREQESEQTFRAYLADTGQGPFLRTGDLGFIKDDELFITGRLKDLIIIRGRNHYPHDIELTAESAHPMLRPGCGASFSVDVSGEEQLVIVCEVDSSCSDPGAVIDSVRQSVSQSHDLQPYAIALIKAGRVPKTSSGKIQRHACRRAYLEHDLDVITESRAAVTASPELEASASPGDFSDFRSIQQWLAVQLAAKLAVNVTEIDVDRPITRYGLDSLMAVELAHSIESNAGIDFPSVNLMQGHSIAQVAAEISEGLNSKSINQEPALAQLENSDEYPLSHGQQGLWFLHNLWPESAAYNIAHAARIQAEINVAALGRAFQLLADRHPCLRTSFAQGANGPVQRVHKQFEAFFRHTDASKWDEPFLKERLVEEANRPFDLQQGPALRCALFSRSAREHFLLLAVHHIVCDLWSLAVMMNELGIIYEAELNRSEISLPKIEAQYADYVRWQRSTLEGPRGERLRRYWEAKLGGELPALDVPTDKARPPIQTFNGASHTFRLSEELTRRLKELGQRNDATLFMVLLAGLQVLLHRYTSQADLTIGSPTTGRSHAEFVNTVGYFVNPVVLRADLAGDPSFKAHLNRARRTVLEAIEHQDYPFALLVESLQSSRDPSRSPLFQIEFVLQRPHLLSQEGLAGFAVGDAGAKLNLKGLPLESVQLERRGAQFDLSLDVAESEAGLAASLEYNTDLFDPRTIEQMARHFQTLLESIVDAPSQKISQLPVMTRSERRQILSEWNNTEAVYPGDPCFIELFEAQVERTPARIAVSFESEQLTYRELNCRANRLAWQLSKLGVDIEVNVALFDERGPNLLTAILAVLKTGGNYLPLDPRYPARRLSQILGLSATRIIVTAGKLMPAASEAVALLDEQKRPFILQVEDLLNEIEGDENLPRRSTGKSSCYVIFTSGSTGLPKGAMIEHRGMLNHLRAKIKDLGLNQSDIVAQTASQSFDISVWQFLATLILGGRVEIFSDDVAYDPWRLLSELQHKRVTILETVPALLWAMIDRISQATQPPDLSALRWMISTGEALQPELCRQWFKSMPDVPMINAYGPTECSDDVTHGFIQEPPADDVINMPLGYTILNMRLYVLDRHLEPAPFRVAGEIYVGGIGVGRGYLNDRQKTAATFIPDPFADEAGARFYKTGDLGCLLPDGNIEFIGRIDNQVKLRGFRIELGEIESVLTRHAALREVVVVVRELAQGDDALVAYVTARDDAEAPSAADLRKYLRERVPDYMVPAAFVVLDQMPLTSSGKINRRALPKPDFDTLAHGREFRAPANSIQAVLAGIWAEVLNVDRVSVDDDFFELGGHSLLATQLISRLRDAFGMDFSLRTLFEAATVASFAERILQQHDPAMLEQAAELLLSIASISDEEAEMMLNGNITIPDNG
jgi:amino acid adenylation domain-containing protein